MQYKNYIITDEDRHQRIDRVLAQHLQDFSRSRIQQLIRDGHLSSGGITILDSAHKVKPQETYQLVIPESEPTTLTPYDLPLNVIYEDAYLLVIDKPAGLTVHPAPGHRDRTLVHALLAHCGTSLSGIGGIQRPGIVHRIDKDTSGLMVVAKQDSTHNHLADQLARRTLSREYLAVVKGHITPPAGQIEGNIGRSTLNRKKMTVVKHGGKPALTYYQTLELFSIASLLRCRLQTGRTHQIRVHLTHVGHPLLGDPLYGKKLKDITFSRQALHATFLKFIHPHTQKPMEFSSPLPLDMESLLQELRGT